MTGPPVPPGTQTIPHIVPRERFDEQHLPADRRSSLGLASTGVPVQPPSAGCWASATGPPRLAWCRPAISPAASCSWLVRAAGIRASTPGRPGVGSRALAGRHPGRDWSSSQRRPTDSPRCVALRKSCRAPLFPVLGGCLGYPGWHLEAVPSMERIPLSAKIAARQVENYFFDKKS